MLAKGLAIGLVAGVMSALLGVGGGIIMVPAMTYLLDIPFKMAVGTSLAVIIPTALSGVARHASFGNVNWKIAAVLAAGAVVGAYGGATLAQKLPELVIKRIFAILLAYTAIRMFLGK